MRGCGRCRCRTKRRDEISVITGERERATVSERATTRELALPPDRVDHTAHHPALDDFTSRRFLSAKKPSRVLQEARRKSNGTTPGRGRACRVTSTLVINVVKVSAAREHARARREQNDTISLVFLT